MVRSITARSPALSERADVNALPLELALDINLAGTAGRIDGMSEVFSLSSGRDTDARSIDLAPLHVQVTTPADKLSPQRWFGPRALTLRQ